MLRCDPWVAETPLLIPFVLNSLITGFVADWILRARPVTGGGSYVRSNGEGGS